MTVSEKEVICFQKSAIMILSPRMNLRSSKNRRQLNFVRSSLRVNIDRLLLGSARMIRNSNSNNNNLWRNQVQKSFVKAVALIRPATFVDLFSTGAIICCLKKVARRREPGGSATGQPPLRLANYGRCLLSRRLLGQLSVMRVFLNGLGSLRGEQCLDFRREKLINRFSRRASLLNWSRSGVASTQ